MSEDVRTIDLRGLRCPLPALRTRKALSRAAPGTVIEVLADDPLAALDIAHLCRTEGHRLIDSRQGSDFGTFRIERGARPQCAEGSE